MCGILGAVGFTLTGAEFGTRLDRLAHRGPDATGIWATLHCDVPVILGHRRLSIIDRTAVANQPMISGPLTIVYNGEIYNYREIRRELVARGRKFRTRSDTEVLLEAWRLWGSDTLRRLRGMFAFAIFDARSGDLFLARDAFGIKPLSYIFNAARGRFAFASEIRALLPFLEEGYATDSAALCASLLYAWVPEHLCAIQGVRKLQPGTLLRFNPRSGLSIDTYWRPEELVGLAADVSSSELGDIVEESVTAHMTADVPVGTFLSGGLDSSLITAIAAQHASGLHCFTVGYRKADQIREATASDLIYAQRLATERGYRLKVVEANPDIVADLERLSARLDEPIGDAAAVNVLQICEAARAQGIKVLLSGMGADELFGGYRRHLAALVASRYRSLPRSIQIAVSGLASVLPVAAGGRGLRTFRSLKRFARLAQLPEEAAYHRSYSYFDSLALNAFTNTRFQAEIDSLFGRHASVYWAGGSGSTDEDRIRRMCLTDLQMFLPGLNLTYTDRASMAASTEVRVPFVDHHVAEAAFRLRGHAKIRDSRQKAALKDAAARWLPTYITDRSKASFGVPLRAWTRNELREVTHDLLPGGWLVGTGLINSKELNRILAANVAGKEDHAQIIWHLLTIELWHRALEDAPDLRARVAAPVALP